MKATVREIVKKVTLELIYDVVDERTREIKDEIRGLHSRMEVSTNRMEQQNMALNARIDQMRQENKEDFKFINTRMDEGFKSVNARIDQTHTRLDHEMKAVNENFKSINARIDQIHTRLDQIMHMLAELRK